MNGVDFLNFAKPLYDSTDEAARRTSVSRSYYASYHQMKEILTSIGIHVSREPKEHQRLVRYLKEGGKTVGIKDDGGWLGELLEQLREARNDADYDLSDRKFNARTCKFSWDMADKICRTINSNLDKYRKSFEGYAKKINELHP